MSWIECQGETNLQICPLPPKIRGRAFEFAKLAKEVYSYNKGKVVLGETKRKDEWADILASPKEKSKNPKMTDIQILLGKIFGFNAAVYQLSAQYDAGFVISFEGTHGNIRTPKTPKGLLDAATDIINCAVDVLGTDLPVNLGDAINKLEYLFPGGIFTKLLNPRGAPGTQYDIADLLTAAVKNKYPGSSIILTGHSLGGGLAQYAAKKHNLRAVVFNSAGLGLDVSRDNLSKQIARFRTVGDLMNDTIVQHSQLTSRQFGTDYVIGIGGHGMDDVLRCLK